MFIVYYNTFFLQCKRQNKIGVGAYLVSSIVGDVGWG